MTTEPLFYTVPTEAVKKVLLRTICMMLCNMHHIHSSYCCHSHTLRPYYHTQKTCNSTCVKIVQFWGCSWTVVLLLATSENRETSALPSPIQTSPSYHFNIVQVGLKEYKTLIETINVT